MRMETNNQTTQNSYQTNFLATKTLSLFSFFKKIRTVLYIYSTIKKKQKRHTYRYVQTYI